MCVLLYILKQFERNPFFNLILNRYWCIEVFSKLYLWLTSNLKRTLCRFSRRVISATGYPTWIDLVCVWFTNRTEKCLACIFFFFLLSLFTHFLPYFSGEARRGAFAGLLGYTTTQEKRLYQINVLPWSGKNQITANKLKWSFIFTTFPLQNTNADSDTLCSVLFRFFLL